MSRQLGSSTAGGPNGHKRAGQGSHAGHNRLSSNAGRTDSMAEESNYSELTSQKSWMPKYPNYWFKSNIWNNFFYWNNL